MMAVSQRPVLSLEGVSKHFESSHGRVQVLTDISLTLNAGTFSIITGPSGAGKSTLLNLIALLDRPTGGRIVLDGRDVSLLADGDMERTRKECFGMVFQRFCLLTRRTILENVVFRFRYMDIAGDEAETLARRALEDVGLGGMEERPVRLLSGGEMQRVAIARAVAWPPKLLLVDEPTGNLDATAAAMVMNQFVRLNQQGVTVLMATHNLSLLSHASRIWELSKGGLNEQPST